jgi:hypothetical protein
MSEKLTFAERAERLAEAAESLDGIAKGIGDLADIVHAEAAALDAARERFANQRRERAAAK